MGRNIENPVRKFFKIDILNKNGVCQIKNCGVKINGNHASNFERHVERFHADEYELLKAEKAIQPEEKSRCCDSKPSTSSNNQQSLSIMNFCTKKISVTITEKELVNACVELVTKNGCPFTMLEYSGF